MKLRTKEENAAHSKLMRERRRITPVSPCVSPIVSPTVKSITHVAPCLECSLVPTKDNLRQEICVLTTENKKLQAKIALLELQIKKGVRSEPLPSGDADLFARNVAAKNARFQKLGMMAH